MYYGGGKKSCCLLLSFLVKKKVWHFVEWKLTKKRGRVIYQRKKNVANEIRPSVFASVPQSVFLVAASKTDEASKTESL